ncbi:MAG TPA: hypothetical protein VG604_01665, partial [Candidatus Saccharimonadales bacterium]|nr:hypothetical protein [Candidatus Saccharimonadales bacterium]
MATDKDTIYIDIDDEITGIIDKLKASDGKVVALVLPKRATVFQSIVNMKLLKRAADNDKKHVVLITAEAGLLPLAGAAGVHVAKTLTSKPELPAGPDGIVEDDEAVPEEANDEPELDPEADGDKPVGQLAGARAAVAEAVNPTPAVGDDGVETLELDDDTPPEEDEEVKTRDFTPPPKSKKDKKLHVPNFENFRKWLIIAGVLLLVVIAGFLFANYNLAKATINIKTDASSVDANADLSLSTTAQSFNPDGNVMPVKLETQKKTYTAQVPTTGQTNTGDKATGTVTITATECSVYPPADIPEGSGVSTPDGQTYITQEDTTFVISGNPKHGCFPYQGTSPTDITAQAGGASYNVPGGTSFKVAFGASGEYSATGSASGGT